jgi:hypothetical protein
VGGLVVRGAASGAAPADLIRDIGDEVRGYVKLIAGLDEDGQESTSDSAARSDALETPATRDEASANHATVEDLQALAKDLLERSAEVELDIDAHPAYAHILRELLPDEARILRFLAERGPQPAVDVRTGGTLGVGKSRLVAPGLNILAVEAGCLRPDHGHQYLNNLHRLGLVWFSREELEDITRYQVLEAQPQVTDAMEDAGRGAQSVRRSLHLTPFGADFCTTCLPVSAENVQTLPREVD